MYDGRVVVVDHPMVQHKLSILRDARTSSMRFRELVRELAMFEAYEATRDLPLEDAVVQTPLATAWCKTISGKKLAIVPILRAGLGMVDGVLELVPAARVGHLGMYRDESTHKPHPYYAKLPEDIAARAVLVVDPMLATGGSAISAVRYLREQGVSGPQGIEALLAADDDLVIYTCSVDDGLNEDAYIVPGLGDAGDRIFGTK